MTSGPSLVQEINSIKELRVHIPCISSQNQVFNLVVRQITNNDLYGDFAKEFLNMIQKTAKTWMKRQFGRTIDTTEPQKFVGYFFKAWQPAMR